jgi:Derlin-2/3
LLIHNRPSATATARIARQQSVVSSRPRHHWRRLFASNNDKRSQRHEAPLSPFSFIGIRKKRLSKISHLPSSSSSSLRQLLTSRGGSLAQDDSDYDISEDEDSSSDAFAGTTASFSSDEFDLDGNDDDDAAFSEESSLERALELWKKTPPFTKTYLTLCAAATGWGYFMNKNQFPDYLTLKWKPTLYKLQLWRPATAFLNLGSFNIGFLMTAHFVWTYMAILERMSHDAPYDFWVMFLFGGASMVLGYGMMGISPLYLGHNVSTFLVYVWSRYHEGLEVNMMELFNTRAELLPWFFLAQTALLEGEFPVLDLLGILFGHIYYHFKSTNVLKTPKAVIDWYHSDSPLSTYIRNQYKTISSDYEMQ